jgi:ADP-heptose:LPS heptosyltransferase
MHPYLAPLIGASSTYNMKILLIRFSSIGDIVLTTPVIRCIKQQIAGAEVHFLTKKSFAGIFTHNPYIDKMHLLGDNLPEIIASLQQEHFDHVIDLHHNLRTLKVKRALGVKSFSFNKLNIEKFLLTNFKVNKMPAIHIVDRLMDTVKTLGVVNDGEGLDYFVADEDKSAIQKLPVSHQQKYIGLVIGAARATKQLPVEKLVELCSQIDHSIVLLGGPEDKNIGDAIAAHFPDKVYNSCGQFSLNESACLVRDAIFIITHDTGLMHIAAAFKKPIISIWGNTVPEFGMTPYYGHHTVRHQRFEIPNLRFQTPASIASNNPTISLGCRPCSKIGYRQCPKKHFKCMNLQNTAEIARLSTKWLAEL